MEDFKNYMLKFLKQKEKQRQEYLKHQGKQRQEDFKRLHESIERQEERFGKLLECLTKENDPENLDIFSQESVINSVGEFIYKPEEVTFEAFFRRYESIFEKKMGKTARREKSKTFTKQIRGGRTWKIRKFYSARQPGEVMFQETIQILTKIFGEQCSLFNTRWQCLNLTKKDCETDTTLASTVNRYCERF